VDVASALDSSTAVPADANGNVNVTVLNFNPGADGSRKVSAHVDPTGTGKNFVKMNVTVNGDPDPKNTGSQQLVATLPAGTNCTGGADKNKCLAQFVSTSGFGNCVVVSQASPGDGSTSPSSSSTLDVPDVGLDVSARSAEGGDKKKGDKKKSNDKKKNGKKDNKKKSGKDDKKKSGKDDKKKSGKDDKKKSGKDDKKKSDKSGNDGKKKSGKDDKVAAANKSGHDKGDEASGKKKKNGKEKVAAKSSGSGKGKSDGKKDKKKQKKGGNKKQAGTRAARAILAEFEWAARAADVVDGLDVDNVE
jgi:hypothetical protein